MAYNTDDNCELRALQLAELGVMRLFVEICEKHRLRYFMIGGTMLGAVRHKGFIPWDDDVDVGMPRPDYERFLQIARAELPQDYALYSFKLDEDYKRSFSKLVDTRVRITNASNIQTSYEYAWVDIFALDGMPAGKLRQGLHFWHVTFWRFLYRASCFELVNLNRPGRPAYLRAIIKFLQITHFGAHLNTRKLLLKQERMLLKYDYDQSPYMINFFGQAMTKEIVDKRMLGEGARYPFEGCLFNGPADYDSYLKQLYGDYMTPPKDADKHKLIIEKIEFTQGKAEEKDA